MEVIQSVSEVKLCRQIMLGDNRRCTEESNLLLLRLIATCQLLDALLVLTLDVHHVRRDRDAAFGTWDVRRQEGLQGPCKWYCKDSVRLLYEVLIEVQKI